MRNLGRSLRDRILPAVLTAAGVALLAAGLLSYTGSAVAADPGSTAPSEIASDPSASLALPTPPPGASAQACRHRARIRTRSRPGS